jgi:hypothetical protein
MALLILRKFGLFRQGPNGGENVRALYQKSPETPWDVAAGVTRTRHPRSGKVPAVMAAPTAGLLVRCGTEAARALANALAVFGINAFLDHSDIGPLLLDRRGCLGERP